MHSKVVPTPSPGQAQNTTSPTTALVVKNRTSTPINLSVSEPCAVDAALPGGHYVRYTSDPGSGIWRTAGDGIRELISPFALQRITLGRHGIEIWVVLPRTGETRLYEGSLDQIASAIHRAGIQIGCRAERKLIFWALTEFCRRQQAARGAC